VLADALVADGVCVCVVDAQSVGLRLGEGESETVDETDAVPQGVAESEPEGDVDTEDEAVGVWPAFCATRSASSAPRSMAGGRARTGHTGAND